MRKRIYGPYAHQRSWRVVVIDADGKRSAHVFESYEEAHDLIQGLDADLEADPGVRVGTAMERYRIRGVGKRQHGKPQLRINEARSWLAVAKQLASARWARSRR